MSGIRSIALASALGLLLAVAAGTLAAQSPTEPPPETEELPETILEGLAERLLSTLRALLETIPQYEMPEVTEDGDIVIRRKRPEREPLGPSGDGEITEL